MNSRRAAGSQRAAGSDAEFGPAVAATRERRVREQLGCIDRSAWSRILAALARRFGDLHLAEDMLQEALAQALQTWPDRGIPENPEAWLMTCAKRKALDVVRREAVLAQKLARLRIEEERSPLSFSLGDPAEQVYDSGASIPDDRLELFFACAHPLLSIDDRVALTLKFVAGLTTHEVAHQLLVPLPTMQQRITRAKKRVRKLGVPFEVPHPTALEERVDTVARVIYLLFTEGFSRSSGADHVRDDLTEEAIRLARTLMSLLPSSVELQGLLALLLLTEARRPARVRFDGQPVPLKNQDRSLWQSELVAEGLRLAEAAAASGINSYSIQAAIAAVHVEAPSFEKTDWAQVAVLYGLLEEREPGPIVRLGLAIARGRAFGPELGLQQLDRLADDPALIRFRQFHIARAVTLDELGRSADAAAAYRRALQLPGNEAENDYLMASVARGR